MFGDIITYRCKICGETNLPGPSCPDCGPLSIEEKFRPDPDQSELPAQPLKVYKVAELEALIEQNPEGIFSKSALIRARLKTLLTEPGTAVPVRLLAQEFTEAKLFSDYRRASVRVRNVAKRAGYRLETKAGCAFIHYDDNKKGDSDG